MAKKPDPILLGLPSPSLRKIVKLSGAELQNHIERLVGEANHIRNRMESLKTRDPVPQEHIEMLQRQLERLNTLEQIGRDKLAGKPSPHLEQLQRARTPRPSHRPTRGYRHRGGSPRAQGATGPAGASDSFGNSFPSRSGGGYSGGYSGGYRSRRDDDTRGNTNGGSPRIDGPGGYE